MVNIPSFTGSYTSQVQDFFRQQYGRDVFCPSMGLHSNCASANNVLGVRIATCNMWKKDRPPATRRSASAPCLTEMRKCSLILRNEGIRSLCPICSIIILDATIPLKNHKNIWGAKMSNLPLDKHFLFFWAACSLSLSRTLEKILRSGQHKFCPSSVFLLQHDHGLL